MFVSQVTLDPVWFTVKASTLGRSSPTSVASAALLLPYLQVRGNAVHSLDSSPDNSSAVKDQRGGGSSEGQLLQGLQGGKYFPNSSLGTSVIETPRG